jgi:hypothetical protein
MDRGKPDREAAPKGVREQGYERLLNEFGAKGRSNPECIQYLVSVGLTDGQARNAIYRYRVRHGPAEGD